MKIFDCFMYFDENLLLDLRLNILDKYVDYFVIVESNFNHKGERKKLNFNINDYKNFENKIIYLIYDKISDNEEKILADDDYNSKNVKYIFNAIHRENGQRNFLINGLDKADDDDIILISDLDEIPNLYNLDFKNIKEKLIFFNQEMFYYKFNLKLPNLNWVGTRSCKKKNLKSPQWLRNIKSKKYPFYRLDLFFSDNKYSDIKFINDGGWHFTNIKTAEQIKYKFESYLHHREFDIKPLSVSEIEQLIKNRTAIYDLNLDKRSEKIGHGSKLIKYNIDNLPHYIKNNLEKYKKWID
jgi:beta-1,4-mannosyl-glycoprotein beta-1,4-N-acetylglucosaminyltransferase